ncbi:Nucleotidyltransferase domain containing protein [Tritrichomonas foetus]|uniref:Nucleotidyltransferase domain containing protein n=1 Tax=Tritrichomonas foetus TaxID=1144522 RepID=A0A1J4KT87_9EUKA|nr:Nucleotidyltransferase domain containing protein [Tritrichomonas foetus]|eukprot:OHT14467.1 Nucleotidyltransferase domain containing protein [Tritrichomonas foetus]
MTSLSYIIEKVSKIQMEKLENYASEVTSKTTLNNQKESPWLFGKTFFHKNANLLLHKEIVEFAKWIRPSKEEIHLRLHSIYIFQNVVSSIWKNAKVIYHGSFAEYSNLPNGDLDLFIINYPQNIDAESIFKELQKKLSEVDFYSKCKIILTSAVPIMKLVDNFFGFKFDISLKNERAAINIIRFRKQMEVYPAMYPILMYVKSLLFPNKMYLPYYGGINSYTLYTMIISVIQSTPEKDQLNCGFLLLKFLKLFGYDFNYYTTGMSIKNGGFLFNKIEKGIIDWNHPEALAVEDQLIYEFYQGKLSYRVQEFKEICQSTYEKIMNNMDLVMKEAKNGNSLLQGTILSLDEFLQKKSEFVQQYNEIFQS